MSRSESRTVTTGPQPSTARFLTVAGSQLVSGAGTFMTEFAVAIAAWVAAALRMRPLARFDDEVPDALPGDMFGVRELRQRRPPAARVKETTR